MANKQAEEEATSSSPKAVQSIEIEPQVKEEDAGDDGSEREPDETADAEGYEPAVSSEQYKALRNITEILSNYKLKVKGDDEHVPSLLFKRIPNKRNLPDYYQIIKEPSAISTLKGKIQRKQYTGIPEFVRDFALIVHNAQVYNRPNSAPVRDVLVLQSLFKEELQKLVEQGLAKEEETVFPDLGEIPDATPEPDPVSEEEEEADDEVEDDDEDDEQDESDDGGRKRRSRRGGRASIAGRKHARDEDDETGKGNDGDMRKRRGRPPKVDTPMEARIKSILKGIRKPKDHAGNLLMRHFERLPDKMEHPHYYQEIKEPIALDAIKKKAKRKKYQSLDHFMRDVDLMFRNAMAYNEDSSEIYRDAKDLHSEALKIAAIERAKPDDEYLMEDGRLPLPNGILYKNEVWKVGDWIHVQNSNDVTKPIVAQIYRTWQDGEGQKWINACWYYRPEQTVHQYEKHFFPNEVVKTGQYRDHQIEEVMDRCFVMFFTRYSRGRPRNVDPTKEVYVCEARYNEEKHRFNKIKTWASCLPDEVRDKDYEMDLFDAPRKIKKLPSPLKHLLKEDATETDEIPPPQWGNADAPPLIGAVHKHARDENQSPPPEPTPPPPPTPPPQPTRLPSANIQPHQPQQQHPPRPSIDRQISSGHGSQAQMTRPSPSMTPQAPPYHPNSVSPAPQYGRQTSYQQNQQPNVPNPYANVVPQTPTQPQVTPYAAQQQLHPPPSLAAAHPTHYAGAAPSQGYGRTPTQPQQAPPYTAYPVINAPESRAREVYILSDIANDSIPKDIRDKFPQDDQGRVLFFTNPPVDTRRPIEGKTESEKGNPLAHTERYLTARAERDKIMLKRKRDALEEETRSQKSIRFGSYGEERDTDGRIKADPVKAARIRAEQGQKIRESELKKQTAILPLLAKGISLLCRQMNDGRSQEYMTRYGENWRAYMEDDELRRADRRVSETDTSAKIGSTHLRVRSESKDEDDWSKQSYHWGTWYKDDFDDRIPR